MRNLILISIIGLTISGCFTKEEPLLPLPPTSVLITSYKPNNGQIFYSLSEQKIVKQNSTESWDIAFGCAQGNYDILLNSGRGMGCFNTKSKDFYQDYKNGDYPWVFDKWNGQKTGNSCIGTWGDFSFENPQSFGNVYLINLGLDLAGKPTGIVKLKIESFESNTYKILVGDLSGRFERHYRVEKNDSFNYVYLSFETSSVRYLEPYKTDWDFLITSYVAPKTPTTSYLFYSVTNELALFDGILVNPYQREIAQQFTYSFDALNYFKAEAYDYTDTTNFIGSKWYKWENASNTFSMSPQNTFVIRDDLKNYYALRFNSFSKTETTRNRIGFSFKSL